MAAGVPGERLQKRVFGKVAPRERREAEQRVARRLRQAPVGRELGPLADSQVPRQPLRLARLLVAEVACASTTFEHRGRGSLVERPPDGRPAPQCPVESPRELDGRCIDDRLRGCHDDRYAGFQQSASLRPVEQPLRKTSRRPGCRPRNAARPAASAAATSPAADSSRSR